MRASVQLSQAATHHPTTFRDNMSMIMQGLRVSDPGEGIKKVATDAGIKRCRDLCRTHFRNLCHDPDMLCDFTNIS
ncbi:MAG: hypothetical protein KFH87_13075 [Bacteroidetes bacterium]|nr:hypothetical protein [Bacteroidota bacterium]